MTLSEQELERYSRQLVLPEWSGAAQERLKQASVIVVGAGALGSPVGQYLAAAGVGRMGLVDDEDALDTARRVSMTEGVLGGISGGAALWGAIQVGTRPENAGKRVVAIVPDSGERYVSLPFFAPQ